MKELTDMAKTGRLTETDIRNLERQPMPGQNGKTFGEVHGTKFKQLRDAVSKQRRTDWNNRQADRKMEREQAELTFIRGLPDKYTNADIDAAEERLDEIMPGVDSKTLDNLKKNSTVDAKVQKRMEAELTALAESGQLTQEVLQDYPLALQRKFRDVAQKQGSSRAANGNYKPQFAAIKAAVENLPQVKAKIEGKFNYTVPLYIAAMEQKFSKLVAAGIAANNPKAVSDAQAQVITEIQALTDGKGITNGQIDSMVAPNNPERTAHYAQKLNQWDTYIQTMGASAFDSPGAFFDTAELKAQEKGYGKPRWKVPAVCSTYPIRQVCLPWKLLTGSEKLLQRMELKTCYPYPHPQVLNMQRLKLILIIRNFLIHTNPLNGLYVDWVPLISMTHPLYLVGMEMLFNRQLMLLALIRRSLLV